MTEDKTSNQRKELYKTIWSIADELRGAVDGWDFKQYVLGIMFYRFISENITNYINEGEKEHDEKFDYRKISDETALLAKDSLVKEKGFFILPSELFYNVEKRADNDENLNITLLNVFKNIEKSAEGEISEKDFAGLFNELDLNSGKLGSTVIERNKRICKILHSIASMNLGNFSDNTIDAFGDAYEYLMNMYASNAGKSGGEFFTPQEVSELLARLAMIGKSEVNKVYDPACGSGSLLLQAIKILGKENIKQGFYGQEINLTTYNLCRINMFLHNIEFDKFDIAHGDTLLDPKHNSDKEFDIILSNPPYSLKWEGDSNPVLISDERFRPAGVLAPKSKSDFAFIMHSLSWLESNGTAAIVCFPGIMYREGTEQKIRKYLIEDNYIDCIINLPVNLFFGPSISTCIMILKKSKKDTNVTFIDASEEFIKSTNINKLSQENIANIVSYYAERKDKKHIVKVATHEEIKNNNYDLSVSKYVERNEKKEEIDIKQLNSQIDSIVSNIDRLRKEINKVIAEIEENDNE